MKECDVCVFIDEDCDCPHKNDNDKIKLLEILRILAQRIPASYIYDINRDEVLKEIDMWMQELNNKEVKKWIQING